MTFARSDFMVSKPVLRQVVVGAFALALSWAGGAQAYARANAGEASAATSPSQPAPPRARDTLVAPPASRLTSQSAAPAASTMRWYGYQIMLADAASLGLGLAVNRPEVLIAGYLLGPAILHATHRQGLQTVMSPVMRALLPALGIAIGTQFKTCNANGDECELGGFFVGGGIGLATAIILDWSLAWKKTASPAPPVSRSALDDDGQTRPASPSGLTFTTAGFALNPNGPGLVLGGRF